MILHFSLTKKNLTRWAQGIWTILFQTDAFPRRWSHEALDAWRLSCGGMRDPWGADPENKLVYGPAIYYTHIYIYYIYNIYRYIYIIYKIYVYIDAYTYLYIYIYRYIYVYMYVLYVCVFWIYSLRGYYISQLIGVTTMLMLHACAFFLRFSQHILMAQRLSISQFCLGNVERTPASDTLW
jgi:hypothetical protein